MAMTLMSVESDHLLPKSPLSGVRWLWSGVLFRPLIELSTAIRPWSLALVARAAGADAVSWSEFSPDGADDRVTRRFARCCSAAIAVPHLQGQPYLDKPPLMYWLVMASY